MNIRRRTVEKDFYKNQINSKFVETQLALNVFQARKNKIDN